jgi:hypothetical protein
MLRPTKHSHPDRTVVGVAIVLLGRLRSRRLVEYDALRKFARKAIAGGDTLFLPALNFLFVLGLVEFRPKTDSLEYLGPNEAQ